MNAETYTQCKLARGAKQQVAWIPTHGAKVGNEVELKTDGQFWLVIDTYDTLPAESIKENERNYTRHREATDI